MRVTISGITIECVKAEQHRIESIAFPAISTGAFGYPIEKAAEIAFRTIMGLAPELNM